jgi:hypothetical protein
MLCVRCDSTVDDLWRWCPECGGVVTQEPLIDLRDDSGFAVDWYAADASSLRAQLQHS